MKRIKALLLICFGLSSIVPVAAFIATCTLLPISASDGKTIGEIIHNPLLILGWLFMPIAFGLSCFSLYIPAWLFAEGVAEWDICMDQKREKERQKQIQKIINSHKI